MGLTTSGKEEQSTRNWQKELLVVLTCCWIRWLTAGGTWVQYRTVKSISLSLVELRAGQCLRMCWRSSLVEEQSGESRQIPVEWLLQCEQRCSVL